MRKKIKRLEIDTQQSNDHNISEQDLRGSIRSPEGNIMTPSKHNPYGYKNSEQPRSQLEEWYKKQEQEKKQKNKKKYSSVMACNIS